MNRLTLLLLCLAAADAFYRRSGSPPEPLGSRGLGITVPAYTTLLDNIDKAATRVKSSLGPNHLNGQFVMLVNAVNKLMDTAYIRAIYHEFYYDTINKAILEALDNPQKAANSVRSQIDKTLSKISAIREVINNKQDTVCKTKISYECDLIIDILVRTSTDDLLKAQAHLIQTVGAEVKSYTDDYANEFESIVNSNDAQSYLVNSRYHLWPLANLGGATRHEAKSVFPSRRFNSLTIELDDDDDY